MPMTDQELAAHLGAIRDAVGSLEGRTVAIRDTFTREFGEDYFSREFIDGFDAALENIRYHVNACYGAIGGSSPMVELEAAGKPRQGDAP